MTTNCSYGGGSVTSGDGSSPAAERPAGTITARARRVTKRRRQVNSGLRFKVAARQRPIHRCARSPGVSALLGRFFLSDHRVRNASSQGPTPLPTTPALQSACCSGARALFALGAGASYLQRRLWHGNGFVPSVIRRLGIGHGLNRGVISEK